MKSLLVMCVLEEAFNNRCFIKKILREAQYVSHLILKETVVLHYSLHLGPSPLIYYDLYSRYSDYHSNGGLLISLLMLHS